jgi:hypothetical protein
MDNALCGGGGQTLTGNALKSVKAAIFMGDPHNRAGLPYNVGTCKAQGVSLLCLPSKSLTNDDISVCRPSSGLPVLSRQHQHHQVVLRLCRPLLLQRQRRQLAPAVRQQVRLPGFGLHQDQGHCLDIWSFRFMKLQCALCTEQRSLYILNITQFHNTKIHVALGVSNALNASRLWRDESVLPVPKCSWSPAFELQV